MKSQNISYFNILSKKQFNSTFLEEMFLNWKQLSCIIRKKGNFIQNRKLLKWSRWGELTRKVEKTKGLLCARAESFLV